jgi:hypothetical protein
MYTEQEGVVIDYLKKFRNKKGIYIIKSKKGKENVLKDICHKLSDFTYESNIAYVGKADCLKTTNLYLRAKQEMGWSNFVGATFMNKIGLYLEYGIKYKKSKKAKLNTRKFILENFDIKCKILPENKELLKWETENIGSLKPSLNSKKNKI